MEALALIAALLLALISIFQLALAAGAPWGAASWGGRHSGVLPKRLRLASAFAGLIVYPWIILLVVDAAQLLDLGLGDRDTRVVVLWVLTGLFSLGALANLASRSRIEKLWAPVAAGVAVCCGVLASSL